MLFSKVAIIPAMEGEMPNKKEGDYKFKLQAEVAAMISVVGKDGYFPVFAVGFNLALTFVVIQLF